MGGVEGLGVVIMAAGAGRRFGGCKSLAPLAGRPLLQWPIDAAAAVAPGHVHLVTGAWDGALREALAAGRLRGVELHHHPGWPAGLGSSIAAGVAALGGR